MSSILTKIPSIAGIGLLGLCIASNFTCLSAQQSWFYDAAAPGGGSSITIPPNDNCSGALEITNPVYTDCSRSTSFFFNTTGATSNDDVAYPPAFLSKCLNCTSTCGPWTNATKDIWFVWEAPETGTYTFSTCGSSFDTMLALYTIGSFYYKCDSLKLLACNDDACDSCGTSSTVYWSAVKGQIYYLRVGGKNQESGWGALTIALGPQNDECESAIWTGYNGTYFDATFATSNACSSTYLPVPAYVQNKNQNAMFFPILPSPNDPTMSGFINYCGDWDCTTQDIWFNTTLKVGSQGFVGLQLNAFTTFPVMIALYTGTCSKLALIACSDCSDNGNGGIFIKGAFSANSVQSFYARIGGQHGSFGTGIIQWFTY